MERQEGHTPGRLSVTFFAEDAEHLPSAEIRGTPRDYRGHPRHDFIAKLEPDWNTHDEWQANAARLVACWNALLGISTAALEKLASLPAKERFGALSDIAKLHEMKEE